MEAGSVERRGECGRETSTSFETDVGDFETSSIMGRSTVGGGGSVAWGGMAKTGGVYVGFKSDDMDHCPVLTSHEWVVFVRSLWC